MANDYTPNRQDPLLSLRAAAGEIGIHHETLKKMVDRGQVPAVKLPNGSIKIRTSAVAMSLNNHNSQKEK
jgi:predicted site-specific integrase-resolvase